VSQRYKLGLAQPEVDFVDVDVRKDVAVYIDPRALRLLRTQWGQECVSLVQDFFASVLAAVQRQDEAEGISLLSGLHEPNETHLGLSRGRSAGSGIGEDLAAALWVSLSDNEAVRSSGLLEDLEETALLVTNIDRDRISDITTNIIREPLIRYTQAMAAYYGIALVDGIDSGPLWSPSTGSWESRHVRLPVVPSGKLLLVPKAIVRRKLDFNYSDYFNNQVLEYLKGVEIAAGSALVHLLKDKTPRVTKKALKEKYGTGKNVAVDLTREYPDMLDQYRTSKRDRPKSPLTHEELAFGPRDLPKWDEAIKELRTIPTGNAGSSKYEAAVERVLSMATHGELTFPTRERRIHEGRKRIDIVYTNCAATGFFNWLARHFSFATTTADWHRCRSPLADVDEHGARSALRLEPAPGAAQPRVTGWARASPVHLRQPTPGGRMAIAVQHNVSRDASPRHREPPGCRFCVIAGVSTRCPRRPLRTEAVVESPHQDRVDGADAVSGAAGDFARAKFPEHDCEGGSGDGPNYTGEVTVVGSDVLISTATATALAATSRCPPDASRRVF